MLESAYHIDSSPDFLEFEFVSIGPKGPISKVVRYEEINVKGIYNLGFGDKDSFTEYIDDLSVSNNSDSQKVLNTVAKTLYFFTDRYPEANVIATGSTLSRTRLYRMGISANLSVIERDFEILGLIDSDWEHFRKNETYRAFWVRRKL